MVRVWICILVLALLPLYALAQTPQSLLQLQFDIVGIRLQVDPSTLTVPKGTPTRINTQLVVPTSSSADTTAALATLTAGTMVTAELRGPSIPPTAITVKPGQPLPLPPLTLPGNYFLDQIRLVKNGQVILEATPNAVPITVLSQLLVTSVTSRPLSLDEIQKAGVIIDQNHFQATNFQLAFNIDGKGTSFTIDLRVALPTTDFLAFHQSDPVAAVKQLTTINRTLAQAAIVKLPAGFDRPGLNFSVAALPFIEADTEAKGTAFGPPPITGLVVIPGNIAFLNQFFSVLLMVTNAAPDGTPLMLRDVQAEIVLPTGLDRVPGTFEAPGDDPLRLAQVQGVGQQAVIAVVQRGPDGVLGTADDVPTLPPQKSGEGQFLVEGLREGSHTMDIAIHAILDGLPSGPIKIMGQAAGAVFVRNPTFSVTLSHPRTVRSGNTYDLYATITNTSLSPANLVSIALDARSISGAELLSADTVRFDTLPSGESATAKFSLKAQETGDVTFSSFTSDPGISGHIQLRTGIGSQDELPAPNAIVLPQTTAALPASLVDAAQRVLGQAFSIASAPAGALPPGVLFVKRQTVVDRGTALAEAGQRVQFGEPLARAMQDLLLDWLGNQTTDDGFDQVLRSTDAGAQFLAEVATIVNASVVPSTVLDYQQGFAQVTVPRTPHLSAIVGLGSATAPVRLTITDDHGQTVGQTATGPSEALPFAGLFNLQNDGGRADLVVLGHLNATRYTVEVVGTGSGQVDLGIVVPAGAGQLTQLRYSGIALAAGGSARVVFDPGGTNAFSLQVDHDGDGLTDETVTPTTVTIVEAPPQVVAVQQLESTSYDTPGNLQDPATHGLLIGVLFDKPVTEESAEAHTNYTVEANAVTGAQLQPSGRLVYLYLQKPVGTLMPRSITLANIADLRNNLLAPTTQPMHLVLAEGAHVFGQVRTADGQPVPEALLELTILFFNETGTSNFTVSRLRTDRNGAYDFDYVTSLGSGLLLTVQDPVTHELATLQAKIRAPGEQLLLNPTFRGHGTVRGHVFGADGATPVPGAPVFLTPSDLKAKKLGANANTLGEYVITNVPVGTYTVRSVDATGAFGQATGVVTTAGAEATTDIVLINPPQQAGTLTGRVFLSDGATPAVGFLVYIGTYTRSTGVLVALDQTTTGAAGSFTFARLRADGYDVVAVDPATQQVGNTAATVVAQLTTSVAVIMEALGNIDGVVFNAQHQPVQGALIAGGTSLVQTDAIGHFHIEGIPAGFRTLDAGDPVTKRRGSVAVTVFAGQTVSVAITLEARATIQGRVLDANGNPVPRATVRLLGSDGYNFVFANNSGVFRFPDLPLGTYEIEAPGPSQDYLIGFMQGLGIDPRVAFTSGDIPANLGGDPSPTASDANAVLAAYQHAIQTFLSVTGPQPAAPPPVAGGFGWSKVTLSQDSTTVTTTVQYLAQGTVSGTTVDSNNMPTGALVRIKSVAPDDAGNPKFTELQRLTSDAQTGAFSFGGIARFDLSTFQTAGIRAGDFTLEAATPFSPTVPQVNGQLSPTTPNQTGAVLKFLPPTETNGTITGTVFMPDGITPAPVGTQVKISFGDLTVTTKELGKFQSLLPIPARSYTLTAEEPTSGFQGVARANVPAGGNVDVQIRLLGLGAVTITVQRPTGQVVTAADVTLEQSNFFGIHHADGTTDANGVVPFVNITEGPFTVMATERGTGLQGRASGIIQRDSEVAVVLTLTGAGRVTGTFVAADGRTPIANAQIGLISNIGIQAFTQTTETGRFELLAIPVGPFTLDGNDPLTGRLGRASGTIRFEGDSTDVTIVQVPRGTVQGFVLQADGVTPVPGASIAIEVFSSLSQTLLQATTRNDGSFRFEGVPAGTFFLTARDLISRFEGRATGTLTFEGQTLAQDVRLEKFGAIHITVLDVDGTPADNAEVRLSGPSSTDPESVDANGEFTFIFLKLGKYDITAHSLAETHNGGVATVTLAAANQTAEATVQLRGIGNVQVKVVEADGTTVVPSTQVQLVAKAAFGDEPSGPFNGTFHAFTNASGVVTLQGVPLGDFFVTGEAGPLAGISTGSLSTPDATVPITVQLGASGSISGRVLLPGGMIAAAGAIVTLHFHPQSALQSGVPQVTTGLLGTFTFSGIPIGPFTISASEIISSGVGTKTGTLSSDGQQINLGDLVLDNTAPRLVGIAPIAGATGVAANSPIVLTFSEPMQPSSFTSTSIGVMNGTTLLSGLLSFSNNDQTVTFTPKTPLQSGKLYTVTVKGGTQDSPTDTVGLPLLDLFVSSFTVQDTVPPTVVPPTSPASGAQQVPPEAVMRVTFSEAIAPPFTMTLSDASNQPVAGQKALALGNTVAIFTPTNFLLPNTHYTLTVANVTDIAGNPLAGGVLTVPFSTVDTIAPVLNALQVQGTPIAGTTVTVQPNVTGTDVARVEYLVNQTPQVVTASPFATSVRLPVGATTLQVTAVAVDQVGNRSAPATRTIAIAANQPPTVTLANLSGATTVAQGQTLSFTVTASDDVALQQVVFSAVGSVTQSTVQMVPGAQSQFQANFSLTIPPAAASNGTITVQAAALDSVGNQSVPATLALQVRDTIKPTVAISSPVANAQVLPGQSVDVVVTASDDVAIASVTLTCTPALNGCGTHPVTPASPSSTQTFTLQIPTTLVAPATIALVASATDDPAGNTSAPVSRTLQIADTVAPTLLALQSLSGSTHVLAGQSVTIQAQASDNVAVTAVVFRTTGALTTPPQTVSASAQGPSATANFPLTVPADATNGSTITVLAQGRDAAGNTSAELSLALQVGDTVPPTGTIVAPPDNSLVTPGQSITLTVRASDDVAVRQIAFSASGVVSGGESRTMTPAVTPVEVSFVLPVPAGTLPGTISLSVTAQDTAGNASLTVLRNVTVLDNLPPSVQMTDPLAGNQVDPRHPLSVTVTATDNAGVTEMGFLASGAASVTETRSISPAVTTTTQTFQVPFATVPPTGGTLTLNATARDAAGNQGIATALTVRVRDVVPPQGVQVTPPAGATNVDPNTLVSVQFSEAINRNTVTTTTLSLTAGGIAVPVTVQVSSDNQLVTLSPVTQPLPLSTLFTLNVGTGITDLAGNALAAPISTTFTTTAPVVTPPQVANVTPADGAANISVATSIQVTFTKPIALATINTTSFSMSAGGTPVSGSFHFSNANTTVRFTPDQPLPFATLITLQLTAAMTDTAGTALVDATGKPLTQPLTFTFTTGSFAIINPVDSSDVIENLTLQLTASGSTALNITTVLFTVNGQALPVVSGPPFVTPFPIPAAATTPALTITAVARNSSGTQVVQDQVTANVVAGLRLQPQMLGVALGGTATLLLDLSIPATTDLEIALQATDPGVVTLPAGPVVILAGQTEVSVPVTGAAVGSTTLLASSSRGTAAAMISVSTPVAHQSLLALAPLVGTFVQPPLSVGQVLVATNSQPTITVPLLPSPATTAIPVTISSSQPAVATVLGTVVIPVGAQEAILPLTTGSADEALLTLQAGTVIRLLTVRVGPPPPDRVPSILALPVGLAVQPPRPPGTAGTLFLDTEGSRLIELELLSAPAVTETSIQASSADPLVADMTPAVFTVPIGQRTAVFTVHTGTTQAETLINLRIGSTDVRTLRVVVGIPPAADIPLTLAPIIGIKVE